MLPVSRSTFRCNVAIRPSKPLPAQDRAELRALGCQLAYRAIEKDVGYLPHAVILAHNAVDTNRLPAHFDDAHPDDSAATRSLPSNNLQFLARIVVEASAYRRGREFADAARPREMPSRYRCDTSG
jgi:hypothetical protein